MRLAAIMHAPMGYQSDRGLRDSYETSTDATQDESTRRDDDSNLRKRRGVSTDARTRLESTHVKTPRTEVNPRVQ